MALIQKVQKEVMAAPSKPKRMDVGRDPLKIELEG
jgi:hypothetical protein